MGNHLIRRKFKRCNKLACKYTLMCQRIILFLTWKSDEFDIYDKFLCFKEKY